MLRKLNKQSRSQLFQQISMKLVRAQIDKFTASKKVLANELYEWRYKKDLATIEALPDGFMNTSTTVKLNGISLPVLSACNVGNYYFPERGSLRVSSWSTDSGRLSLPKKRRVTVADEYGVEIHKSDLTKRMLAKVEKADKEGGDLCKNIDSMLTELCNVLINCKTVKELRSELPEFSSFYPSDNVDSFPAVVVDTDIIKAAAQKWAINNPQPAT